jgi:SAM-dependent methyltransferase
MRKQYVFDVDKAREFVGDGREAEYLDDDDVRFSLKKCRVNKEHTQHVDPSIPGIVATVFYPGEDGVQVKGQRLIDGHHRAARCLELGIPYRVYVLNDEESAQIVIKSPKPRAAATQSDPKAHNRAAWNDRVDRQARFTHPADDAYLARYRGKLAEGWLTDVCGKRVLLLAAGGGRSSARYAEAGAIVTVVDISGRMLDLDRQVAAERGYDFRLVETSMDDLSMLKDGSFDIVNQPVSTCYVPDVLPVYREVARVLVSGGIYISQHKQPTSLQASLRPSRRGYELVEPYYRSGPLRSVSGSCLREEGTIEFLHRWEELVGGMCRSGFVIEDLSEPRHGKADAKPGDYKHLCYYAEPYVRIKARRVTG